MSGWSPASALRWLFDSDHAAGGGIYRNVFRAGGISAGMGRRKQAIACELVFAGVGMLSNLFRIGRCKDPGRRPAMAQFHGAGRVLPERTVANLDWLVHAAFSAVVSCGDGVWNTGAGIGARVDDVSPEAAANLVLLDCHALADRDHSLGELHVLELPGAGFGVFAARRPILADLLSEIPEKELPCHQRGQTSCRAGSPKQMAKDSPGARLSSEDRCDGGDAHVDFLCDAGANGVDGQAVAAGDDANLRPGTISHRQPAWGVCGEDARAGRKRVSRLGRRTSVVRLSFPLQTARSKQTAGDLRAISG